MPSKHGVNWSSEGHLSLLPAHQVVRVYCYLTVVSLQYLTPLILTLNCTLLLKTLGERKLPCGVRVAWGSLRHPGLSLASSAPHPPVPVSPYFTPPSYSRPSLYSLLTGGYSWGLGEALPLAPALAAAQDGPVGPTEDEAQQAAARITGALGGLLTPLFLRGILAFLIWWTAACQLLSSLFGLYFHQHLAGS